MPRERHRRHEIGEYLARCGFDLTLACNVVQDDYELVAAKARYDIAFTHTAAQPVRRFNQEAVAGRMTKRVIDDFEAVEVNEEHCAFAVRAARTCNGLL